MQTIDLSIFYALHGLAGHFVLLDWLIIFVGDYLIYPLLLVVAYYAYRAWRGRRFNRLYGYGMAVASALVARLDVAEGIRLFYHRTRPYIDLHLPHLLTDTAYSFPSGHTIFMFALATGVYRVNKKLAYWLFASGALIGLARVAGGVHYPSDILGGALLGTGTAYLLFESWGALYRKVNIPYYE